MSLFQDKKTIQLSDLVYALNRYKNIYNNCLTEIGKIITDKIDEKIWKNDTLYYQRNKVGRIELYTSSNNRVYTTHKTIDDLIKLYASEETKKNISICNQLLSHKIFDNMTIEYKGIKSKINKKTECKNIINKYHCYLNSYFIEGFKDYKDIINSFSKENPKIEIAPASKYNEFIKLLELNKKLDSLFDEDGNLYDQYKGKNLENFDLSKIDFDNKNISGLDISHNLDVKINFNKIKKDISSCNFNGYNLTKETLRNFNIIDTDLRNTGATIDLESCTLSHEGKMNPGTLFDDDNKFIFGDKKLSDKQVKELGIKIYKKEL